MSFTDKEYFRDSFCKVSSDAKCLLCRGSGKACKNAEYYDCPSCTEEKPLADRWDEAYERFNKAMKESQEALEKLGKILRGEEV